MSGQLYVGLLGPFEVQVAGAHVGPAGSRRRGLLALLALEANAVVGVDSLVDRLWGDQPPASAVNLIQTYVSAWRKAIAGQRRPALGGPLVTVGAGYRLELGTEQCDLLLFRSLVARGRRADADGRYEDSARLYEEALDLWRGPALVDLSMDAFYVRLAPELDADRLLAIESWAGAALRSGGDPASVVRILSPARTREPLRESLTELLMWAQTACGRQSDALDAFMATRDRLRAELGADPGPALTSMQSRVLRGDPTLQVGATATGSSTTPPASAVPARVDRFVGRESELEELQRLLSSTRLVTLTGPGGAGKTRLALELLARQAAGGASGWFVDLAPLRQVSLAPATIASVLGLQLTAGTDPLRALGSHLLQTSGVLVLDNLEHLDGIHHVVDRLHRETRHLRLLTTSREPLRVEGEQQYPVPLLPVPSPHTGTDLRTLLANESMRLLVDRAQAHDPSFTLTPQNATDMSDIARRLEGLPLALEIAAPWLRLLTPEGLAARLRITPLDVPGRRADSPARHRTLRDTISWSFDLLPMAEQELLCRLSVFAGSFTVESAEAICARSDTSSDEFAENLFNLVERNLVQATPPQGGQTRFRLLQTVREFAVERARETAAVDPVALGDRHSQWYAGWAARLAAHSEGPESPAWLAVAVAEADNLRAAMDTCAETGRDDDHLQLVADSMTLWFEAGHEQEGEQRLRGALAAASPGASSRAIALTYWGWLRASLNRNEAAQAAQEAVELARASGDAPVEAFALQTLGDTLEDADESEAASRAALGVADRAESVDIRYGPTAPAAVRCGASYNLAAVWLYRSVPAALTWQAEALRLAELEGDLRIIAVNAARLSLVHLLAGDLDAARTSLSRSRDLVSTLVTARWEDIVRYAEAQLAHVEGRSDEAEEILVRLFASASSGGRPLHTILGAAALADLYTESGRLGRAAAVLAKVEAGTGALADPVHVARVRVRRSRVARLEGRPDDAERDLGSVARGLSNDSLPPERVVWLLESTELAAARGDSAAATLLLDDLDAARVRTGVHLAPWEDRRRLALTASLSAG